MSRQRLSYADLEPSTSTNVFSNTFVPNDANLSGEPPRKRMKTASSINQVNYVHGRLPPSNGNSYHHNGPSGSINKRGKNKRPGNPSGVHWTQHWDTQTEREIGGLAYDQSQPTLPMNNSNPFHPRTTNDGRFPNANRQPVYARNVPNKPNSQASFIGPIVPTSPHAANFNASGMNGNANSNGQVSKKKKNRGRRGSNANQNNQGQENMGNQKPKPNKYKPTMQLGQDWDDSALIDAWDAAEAEYRKMNGGKKWNLESVKHSVLWHDTILSDDLDQQSDDETSGLDYDEDAQAEVLDEGPAEEETFEEHNTHNLDILPGTSGVDAKGTTPEIRIPKIPIPSVGLPTTHASPLSSMEEAFQMAKDASYALGYWTAIYNYNQGLHSASKGKGKSTTSVEMAVQEPVEYAEDQYEGEDVEEDAEDEDEDEGEHEQMDGFVATQRRIS